MTLLEGSRRWWEAGLTKMKLSAARNRIKMLIWKSARVIINRKNRRRLKNTSFTIISQNCNGGILYHDLGLAFLSPTINLYMENSDFINFCERLDYYLQVDMTEYKDEHYYSPIGMIDDVKIYLEHYQTFEEAKNKWDVRKKRVNLDNLFIMMTDRDGCTPDLKARFAQLPYRKVMFVHRPEEHKGDFYYIRGFESEDCVGILNAPDSTLGYRYIDQFDYVSFFNQGVSEESISRGKVS